MNKEICLTALSKLQRLEYEENQCDEYSTVINELIYEHFHNPPLRFEELKEGMWVWDNVLKEYIHILTIDFEVPSEGLIETENEYVPFEEGRFYRKQVEE